MLIEEASRADAKGGTVQDILDLLQEGESNIIYGTNKDVILLLGTTGSGKSTFTQFIAGYDYNLISEETRKNSHEYIIIDKNGKVGNSTFTSQTIFPDLVLDTETSAAFYDCPGFSDTRSPAHDIAATYFIKKVLDHAERVKLVFTTNYPSVREGVDRQALLTLVKNAVEMIKYVKKFDNSIALIVTKVDNIYDTEENENGGITATLRPDESIVESIANFLKQFKDYLQSQTSGKGLDNSKAVEFVDALLHQKDGKYTNIGLFRRPNKAGVLTSIKLLQSRKPALKKIIHENILYNAYNTNDFGYTISADSQNHLYDLITKINENIVTGILNIGQEIEKNYKSQEEPTSDIKNLYNTFRLGYDALSATKTSALSVTEPQQLLKMITKNVIDLDISISKENFQNITNHGEYLKFIKTIDRTSNVMKPTEWAQALTNVVGYLDDSQRWYSFLNNFYDILSKYDVQQDYRQYSSSVDSLKYQIGINENNSQLVLAQLKQFLDKINKEESEKQYPNIKDVKLNKPKLKILTDLLNLALKYNVDSSCKDNNLIIKGQFIRLKDISSANCEKPKVVKIFALNKVFIDTDLDKTGEQVQLSIIAPKWEVIGSPSIILNGSPGSSLNPGKAKNAIAPGAAGDDGKPGEPGGPTGHFLSIAQNVVNGEYLKLSIVGGQGGPGQEGGDGKEGKDGTVPGVPRNGADPSWGPGFAVNDEILIDKYWRDLGENHIVWYWEWHSRWWVRGQDCIDGGNGGSGGVGGKGGKSVDAVVVNLVKSPEFAISNHKGDTGTGGSGGKGARGGSKRGQLLTLYGHSLQLKSIWGDPTPSYKYTVVSREDLKQCSSGRYGNTGKNDKNIKEPAEVVLSQLPSVAVNDYKNYLRDNLSNSVIESFLRKFLDDLERHKSVEMLYNVFGFVNELQGLEDQFYTLRKKLSLLPFYKSLSNRISEYTDKLYKNNELKDDNKKVLGYLYTATLSKIYSINNNAGSNLVMDLPEYLKLTIKEINRLKDVGNIAAISEEQTKYQKEIVKKINEAQSFVETQINPEINNVFYQIDHQIELLIDEIIALQNAAQVEKQKLEEQQRQLEDTLALKMLFGIPKMASQFLSFLGPVGAAAGAVIGGGIMVTESLVLDPSSTAGSETIAALPAAVKNSLSKLTEQLKEQQALFKEQLADSQKELKDFTNNKPAADIKDMKDIEKKVEETKNELEKEMAQGSFLDPEAVDKMYNMRKEVAGLLEKKKDILEKLKPGQEAKINQQLKMVKRIQDIVSAVQIPIDFYNKIKKDQAKINELSLAIKRADEKMRQLMIYEQSIYSTMIPICKNIENKVNDMESNLQGKSHSALDISKWQIQSTLRDIKLEMQKMTKGFKIQEDLSRCIEKLEEGMTIMINMYDRIEDYHDKAELADYIANINSNRANQITISNPVLRHEVDNLRWIIQSNLVLAKYQTGMDAFRQHIYPFAEYFLQEFDLPTSLQSNDTNSLVAKTDEQMTVLRSKLIESKITITDYDKVRWSNVLFDGGENNLPPFFVWKSSKNKNAIKNLLEGKEITMKADVKEGLNRNAIKFNRVKINFKLANETMQNELNKQLEAFQVEMIHLGTSYYRCENKFYTIPSTNQTITYTFARDENGDPKNSNDVYKKLEKHEPVLSPYTLWNLKISLFDQSRGFLFNALEKYKDAEIDLELVGKGQYVERGIDVCNNDLNKYYAADETIFEIDHNIDLPKKQQFLPVIRAIKSISTLSKINAKHLTRKRRSVDEHQESARDYNTNSFATSGASSSVKSSFINNIFNLIGSGLVAYEYLIPINKIGQWFKTGEKIDDVYHDFKPLDVAVPETLNRLNPQTLDSELPVASNLFINQESSTVGSSPSVLMFCNNGNLLLLDMIARRKSGIKYQHTDFVVDQKPDSEFAQNLAYRAYAP
ncbi:uncharacterized protein LOC107980959 [Nasonia vitripennis]|uniref:G domain-containing protein n=1 Tax=Nasonia vitripennis TaxID=7425 RepID=A0A7M7J2Y3_NASVI|nr:uncharacterized protein LOC107980959 [Nasonia vitripennis]